MNETKDKVSYLSQMAEKALQGSFMKARPSCALVFDEDTEWTDRTLATASWWDRYSISRGAYPVALTNIDGQPWNANPDACTPGYLANIGPYYAKFEVSAVLVESYRENRLMNAVSAKTTQHFSPQILTLTVYAYQLERGKRHFGGRIAHFDDLIYCDCDAGEATFQHHDPDCGVFL